MDNQSSLIGVGGPKEHGKDAFADVLVEKFGWVKLNMSSPLNDALLELNPLVPMGGGAVEPYADLVRRVGYVEAKQNAEVRRLLQTLGTEIGRNLIGPDTWVNIARRNIAAIRSTGKNVIVTGIRFPNEIEMVSGSGGILIYVNRPGYTLNSGVGTQHPSETSLSSDAFGSIIYNDGTLEDLTAVAERVGRSGKLDEGYTLGSVSASRFNAHAH